MERRRGLERVLLLLFLSQVAWTVILPVTTPKPSQSTMSMPYIKPAEMDSAFQQADKTGQEKSVLEGKLKSTGGIIDKGSNSAQARHQRFTAIEPQSMKIDAVQSPFEEASRNLVRMKNLNKDQASRGLKQVDLPHGSNRAQTALQNCNNMFNAGQCDSRNVFRMPDGSCNNLNNPLWGKSFTCFDRLEPPDYADGLMLPRVAQSGNPLPNPRVISQMIHNDINRVSLQYTVMTMQWGQFMDHDLTLTPMTRAGSNMDMIECCPFTNPQQRHPECFPIEIPPNDSFFSQFREDCLNFVRSATCNSDCNLGPRQQTNQLTGQIDASNIYGSTKNDSDTLRLFRGGELRSQVFNVGELLPRSNTPNEDQCSRPQQNAFCFLAGDERVNEQPGLTSMHTIWLRQHNQIARFFQQLIPDASDDEIFQETRRLVAAQLQMITYNEFLPVVLGPDYMDEYGLWVRNSGYTSYDSSMKLGILTEFSTAAYRFGHTLIPNTFEEVDGRDNTVNGLNLKDNFFFPFTLHNGEIDYILRGLCARGAQNFDRNIVEAVTNHLYKPRGDPFGMDLPALNLQRGRDHGVNGYATYVRGCFGVPVQDFSDLSQFISSGNLQLLSNNYEHVDDIDLFTGGVSEIPLPGAVVGPTFACIIGEQFKRLKYGDRFYFEHGDSPITSFTRGQLNEIRKTTLAQVICSNSDNIQSINRNVFLPTNTRNYFDCQSLPFPDLRAWNY